MSYFSFFTTVCLRVGRLFSSSAAFLVLFAVQRRRFVFVDDVVYFNNDGDLASWFMREKMTVDSTTIEKPNTRR